MSSTTSAHQIFISYSREDAGLVNPVVRILKLGKELVFLDTADVALGREWRPQTSAAISSARVVLVFWCAHSSTSREVDWEYQTAIGAGKEIVPILLDGTPLPQSLANFQWVDLTAFGRSQHSRLRRLLSRVGLGFLYVALRSLKWVVPLALGAAFLMFPLLLVSLPALLIMLIDLAFLALVVQLYEIWSRSRQKRAAETLMDAVWARLAPTP